MLGSFSPSASSPGFFCLPSASCAPSWDCGRSLPRFTSMATIGFSPHGQQQQQWPVVVVVVVVVLVPRVWLSFCCCQQRSWGGECNGGNKGRGGRLICGRADSPIKRHSQNMQIGLAAHGTGRQIWREGTCVPNRMTYFSTRCVSHWLFLTG